MRYIRSCVSRHEELTPLMDLLRDTEYGRN
jgi:hypothetical protein